MSVEWTEAQTGRLGYPAIAAVSLVGICTSGIAVLELVAARPPAPAGTHGHLQNTTTFPRLSIRFSEGGNGEWPD